MVLDTTNPLPDSRDHRQFAWNERFTAEVKQNAPMWFREDFGMETDWTSTALVPLAAESKLAIIARVEGVIGGSSSS